MEHLGFAGHACQLHRTPHEQMLGRVDPIWLHRAEGSANAWVNLITTSRGDRNPHMMVNVREIIPFYGRIIQFSEL